MSTDGLQAAAIDAVARMAKETVRSTLIQIPGAPEGTLLLCKPDGTHETIQPIPLAATDELHSPAALADYVKALFTKDEGSIFVNEAGITAYANDQERTAQAHCKLETTPQFQTLAKIRQTSFSQRDFVRLLRIDLDGCHLSDALLTTVRNMRFSDAAQGTIAHGRESLGKQVLAQTTGEEEIPEQVVLRVPLWNKIPLTADVRCAIVLNVEERKFGLVAFPGSLEKAIDDGLKALVVSFLNRPELPPIFYGSPASHPEIPLGPLS